MYCQKHFLSLPKKFNKFTNTNRNNIKMFNDIHFKRRQLNSIFYSCSPLNGDELCELVDSRRLQFSAVENGIELFVHTEKWDIYDDMMWNGMSNVLNTWNAGDQIREKTKFLKENELLVIPIFIPATVKYDDDEYYHIIGTSSF